MELYRYLPFHRFIQILFNKELTLISPSKWPDQYEQYWLKMLATKNGQQALMNYAENCEQTANSIAELNNVIYNNAYCLSFSKDRDSEVLWNAHSDGNKAIMIETTRDKLLKIAENYNPKVDEVKYDLEQSSGIIDFLSDYIKSSKGIVRYDTDKIFLHKRECFSYENEVRLITYCYEERNDSVLPLDIGDLADLINGVMVHPLADSAYVELIRLLCSHFKLNFYGKSGIYDFSELQERKQ